MQVTVEDIDQVTKKVSIELPAEQVDAEFQNAYTQFQKKARLQGFRPGKAPMQLVKRTYIDSIRDEVMRRLYEQSMYKAFIDQKVFPIDSPEVESDELMEGASFKYTATIEIAPEIELRDYTGLEVKKEKYVFKPEDIDNEIKMMQENVAQMVPVDDNTVIEQGFVVTLDFSAAVEGHPEEAYSGKDTPFEIGSFRHLPGFTEQLIGMKSGEQKKFSIILPAEYKNPAAAGKEAQFDVTVKEVKRKELPELNDEFAQQYGNFANMDELRVKLQEFRQNEIAERIEREMKERLIKALIAKNPLTVPKTLVKRQLEHMLEEAKQRLQAQRMTLEMMGLAEDSFREHFRESAENKVKGGLLLGSLISKENFAVEDADIEKRYAEIAGGVQDRIERIREYYGGNEEARKALIADVKEDKALSFLLEHAVITEVDPEELKAA